MRRTPQKPQLTEREDALTKQRAGEPRDEALKRRVVVLKPSNKDFRHLAILLCGCNGGLSSPVCRARFFPRLPQFALEVSDPLFSGTQSRLRRRQFTSGDKPLASFLCLHGNSLKPFVRLLDDGQFLLRALLRCQSVSRFKLQTLHSTKKVNPSKIPKCPPAEIQRVRTRGLAIKKFLSAHPLKFSECALGDWQSKNS